MIVPPIVGVPRLMRCDVGPSSRTNWPYCLRISHLMNTGVRGILYAALFSLVMSLLGTPVFIRWLIRKQYGQFVRDDGPTSHRIKRGTPTMGGTIILGATLGAYLLAHLFTRTLPSASGLLVLFLMTGLGTDGFLDEYIKISKQRSLGLRLSLIHISEP